jgi:hypothetical protein
MDENRGPEEAVSYFAESDYRFGAGPLRIRVKRVDWQRPISYDDDNWYEVDGIEVTAEGREVGRRQALVRGRSLGTLRKNGGPNAPGSSAPGSNAPGGGGGPDRRRRESG